MRPTIILDTADEKSKYCGFTRAQTKAHGLGLRTVPAPLELVELNNLPSAPAAHCRICTSAVN